MNCDICHEPSERRHGMMFTDGKGRRSEVKGCKSCVDDLFDRYKVVQDKDKMNNEKLLSVLGIETEETK